MFEDLGNPSSWYDYRRRRFWALALVLLYTLTGFFVAPWVLGKIAPDLARDYLGRDIAIGKIRVNPWSLRLQVDDFRLLGTDERDMLNFDSLIVNVQLSSIFMVTLDFYEITLTRPQIHLVRYRFADTNWGRVLNNYQAATAATPDAEPATADNKPLGLHISNLAINDGSLEMLDALNADGFTTSIEPISVVVSDLSTRENVKGAEEIKLTTETGMDLIWTGSLELSPLISAGTIELSGTPLPTVYRYFEKQLGFTLNHCCLEVAFDYSIDSLTDGGITADISDGSIVLSNLELDGKATEEPVLRLPEVRASGGRLSWPAQTAHIDQLLINKPELFIRLAEDGTLNLNKMLVTQVPDQTAEDLATDDVTANDATAVDTMTDTKADTTNNEETGEIAAAVETTSEPAAATPEANPWTLTLGEFRIADMLLGISDRSINEPGELEVNPMNLSVREISNAPGSSWPLTYNATLSSGGQLAFEGTLVAQPEVHTSGTLNIESLGLAGFQPWIAEMAQIRIERGTVDVAGTIESSPDETLALAADITVADLSISDTRHKETLLGWQQLELAKTELQLDGNALTVSKVSVVEPFARVNIAADGSTNFQSLAIEPAANPASDPTASKGMPATAATDTDKTPPPTVRIGRTTVKNGSVDFSDRSLPLPFRALISEFAGSMSTVDSTSRQPSELNFTGRVGEYGLMTLKGDVSVMAPTEQTALQLEFRNLEMPTLSPYTAEFVGRKIDSGKLELDLNYTVQEQKLLGENGIVITDFSLGDNIESANAMSLPLDLAIALLTDTNGVIDLDMKVSGDLDDPSFSASGIVVKAFSNLITKLVTAPFKLLGGLVPGGSELDLEVIEFVPGTADLAPPEREKLTQLSAGLAQRPVLQLQVDGGYSRDADIPAMQKINVDNQVATLTDEPAETGEYAHAVRKAREKLAKQQLPDLSLKELRDAYRQPDPTTGKRVFDELAYSAELQAQLEAVQPIDDGSLEILARQRRDMVLAFLTSLDDLDQSSFIAGGTIEAETDDSGWVRIPLVINVAETPPGN
jgi:hypothetical protein